MQNPLFGGVLLGSEPKRLFPKLCSLYYIGSIIKSIVINRKKNRPILKDERKKREK